MSEPDKIFLGWREMQAEGTARGRAAKDDPFLTHMPTAFHGSTKKDKIKPKMSSVALGWSLT